MALTNNFPEVSGKSPTPHDNPFAIADKTHGVSIQAKAHGYQQVIKQRAAVSVQQQQYLALHGADLHNMHNLHFDAKDKEPRSVKPFKKKASFQNGSMSNQSNHSHRLSQLQSQQQTHKPRYDPQGSQS